MILYFHMEKQYHCCRFQSFSELRDQVQRVVADQSKSRYVESAFKRSVGGFKEHLNESFKTDCLSYALLKLLPYSIKNTSGKEGAELSWSIKEAYFRMISHSVSKDSEFFEPMAVYLTNLGVRVFRELIPEVEWSEVEGQMCIVWYFLLLGVTVSQEVYGQLAKKYLNQHSKKQDRSSDSATVGMRTTKSGKRMLKGMGGQKYMRTCKSIGSGLTCHSISSKAKHKKTKVFFRSSAFNKEEISMVDQYKEEIKNNLTVEVLPPVKVQRIKLKAEHIKTEPCQKDGQSFIKQSSTEVRPPKSQSFYPHQVSTTLTSFYPKEPNLRGSKMKRTRFSVSTFKLSRALELSNTLTGDSPSQIEAAGEVVAERENKPKAEDWGSIIHSLKKKVAGMRKEKDQFNRHKKEERDTAQLKDNQDGQLTRIHTAAVIPGPDLKQSTLNRDRVFVELQLPESSSKIAARIESGPAKMRAKITEEPDRVRVPVSFALKKKRRGFEEECKGRKERAIDTPTLRRGKRMSFSRMLDMVK